jgi:hypothetical protein
MNKGILALCLASTAALNSPVMADDACDVAINKAKASLVAADETNSIDKASKCKAYMHASQVLGDTLTVCKNALKTDADEKALEAKITPVMRQLAQSEQTYCAR